MYAYRRYVRRVTDASLRLRVLTIFLKKYIAPRFAYTITDEQAELLAGLILWITVCKAAEHYDLFPNGHYEIEMIDGECIGRFEANLLFSQRRVFRSVEAVVGDIETLLSHCGTDRL